jgi:large subunit ribosomal protein L6
VSRIGKMPVVVPDKVQVKIEDSVLRAKGPLGELSVHIPEGVSYNIQDDNIIFDRKDNNKKNRALHGLTRMLWFFCLWFCHYFI